MSVRVVFPTNSLFVAHISMSYILSEHAAECMMHILHEHTHMNSDAMCASVSVCVTRRDAMRKCTRRCQPFSMHSACTNAGSNRGAHNCVSLNAGRNARVNIAPIQCSRAHVCPWKSNTVLARANRLPRFEDESISSFTWRGLSRRISDFRLRAQPILRMMHDNCSVERFASAKLVQITTWLDDGWWFFFRVQIFVRFDALMKYCDVKNDSNSPY